MCISTSGSHWFTITFTFTFSTLASCSVILLVNEELMYFIFVPKADMMVSLYNFNKIYLTYFNILYNNITITITININILVCKIERIYI